MKKIINVIQSNTFLFLLFVISTFLYVVGTQGVIHLQKKIIDSQKGTLFIESNYVYSQSIFLITKNLYPTNSNQNPIKQDVPTLYAIINRLELNVKNDEDKRPN